MGDNKINRETFLAENKTRVSAHERLNITRDFGPHGCLPGIKMPYYVCIEAATVTP